MVSHLPLGNTHTLPYHEKHSATHLWADGHVLPAVLPNHGDLDNHCAALMSHGDGHGSSSSPLSVNRQVQLPIDGEDERQGDYAVYLFIVIFLYLLFGVKILKYYSVYVEARGVCVCT